MIPKISKVYDTVLRTNFYAFVQKCFTTLCPGQDFSHHKGITIMTDALLRCHNGEFNRLIINIPPRHLKSIMLISYTAWVLGHDPKERIICVSYSQELSVNHMRMFRAIIKSDWYRRLFPNMKISSTKDTEQEMVTTKHGYRYATSVGGTLTGRGGNLIIIDDPIKPDEAVSDAQRQTVNDWYSHTLYSRLDSKVESKIIIVMQRLHVNDLTAHALENENWEVISLPAIAEERSEYKTLSNKLIIREKDEVLDPQRESLDVLRTIKQTLGSDIFSAQYQQSPIQPGGNIVKWEWFKFYDKQPAIQNDDIIVQSWDTAAKADELNDYSVCTTWLRRGQQHYLLDVFRERLAYPDLRKKAIELYKTYKADSILVEDCGSGIQLIQDLRMELKIRPVMIKPKEDKATRLSNQTAKIEAGNVFLPRSASWMDAFKREILAFPQSAHDDQVDSLSQYLGWRQFDYNKLPNVTLIYSSGGKLSDRDPFAYR